MSGKIANPDIRTQAPLPEIGSAGFTLIVAMVGVFAVTLAALNPAHTPPVQDTPAEHLPLSDVTTAPSTGFVNFTSEQLPFRADLYDLAAFGDQEQRPR